MESSIRHLVDFSGTNCHTSSRDLAARRLTRRQVPISRLGSGLPCLRWRVRPIQTNAAPLPADKDCGVCRNVGHAVTRDSRGRQKAEHSRSADARGTRTDTALVKAGSAGLGMHMEGEGGSGRESSGEGNCSSMPITVYLKNRVGSGIAKV
jgi:hypothetical protein